LYLEGKRSTAAPKGKKQRRRRRTGATDITSQNLRGQKSGQSTKRAHESAGGKKDPPKERPRRVQRGKNKKKEERKKKREFFSRKAGNVGKKGHCGNNGCSWGEQVLTGKEKWLKRGNAGRK